MTPHHSVPLPVAACPILVMRYVHLNDIEQRKVGQVFKRKAPKDTIITSFGIDMTNRAFQTLRLKTWIIGDVSNC